MNNMTAEYLYHSGSDLDVANAARVSMAKESEELDDDDVRIINYLAKHNHWTPFAHNSITIRASAPVPIRTQCFKHKFGFVENEESRRYISFEPTYFLPDKFRASAANVKQGSGGVHQYSEAIRRSYVAQCETAVALYNTFIKEGICPEQARFVLPQGVIVNWVWTGSLAAYARFYNLRTDPHAQKEIQELARMIGKIVKPLFPISWMELVKSETPRGATGE